MPNSRVHIGTTTTFANYEGLMRASMRLNAGAGERWIDANLDEATVSDIDEAPQTKKPKSREEHIKEILLSRHLDRNERQSLHNPKSDWSDTGRGDVCKNACTLEVNDILSKHKIM